MKTDTSQTASRRLPLCSLCLFPLLREKLLAALVLGLTCAGLRGGLPPDDSHPKGRVEILWDKWEVPHFFAQDLEALGFAYGWAQLEAHGNLILRLYGESRGRAAEYWGGAENLERDRLVHTFGIPELAREWSEKQPPEFGRFLRSFVAGMNAYATEHGDQLDAPAKLVLPVEGSDVLGHLLRAIHFTFVARMDEVRGQSEGWERRPGSNAWAVAPKRSASGHCLLLANPHLPWNGLFMWFEAHWNAPGLESYGASLVGLPLLAIAFNEHLGWTHTVNTHDGSDLYELSLSGEGYRWDGMVKAFATTEKILRVRQADHSLRDERLIIRRSVHGPVISQKQGRALALRVVGLDSPGIGQQYLDMVRAKDLTEFEGALRTLQMPMFTVLYADRKGHILHLFGGQTPVRPEGPYSWSGIVPGDTSATLWTRSLPYDQLPRVLDPPSGWLQNANDPPWTTTLPAALNPAKFPAYLAPRGMAFRPQRSARLLLSDDQFTFDELVAAKHDTRVEMADRILDDLFAAVEKTESPKAREAAQVLRAWDRHVDADSRGGELFEVFVSELMKRNQGRIPFAIAWDENRPLDTPDGLKNEAGVVAALELAVDSMRAEKKPLDIPWGDTHRLQRGAIDLPGNGSRDPFGVFRAISYRRGKDGRMTAAGGDSYVCAVEFSQPVRAQAVLSYGNASQPGAKHRDDQLELLSRKQLRPVWLKRSDIEANLDRREPF